MTNEDLQQISNLLDQKLDQKLKPIQEDINILKQDVSGLKQDVSGLKQDVSGLKQGQVSLRQDVSSLKQGQKSLQQGQAKLGKSIEDLARNTQDGFVELESKFKNEMFKHKVGLEDKIDGLIKEHDQTRHDITTSEERVMTKIDDLEKSQFVNIGEHDGIKDNHGKLKKRVDGHEVRIRTLEPALA